MPSLRKEVSGMIGIKKTLDIVLLLLLIAELGGTVLPVPMHRILGFVLAALVIVHNVVNRNFYTTLDKGAYTKRRLVNTVAILLFVLAFVLVTVSGVGMGLARKAGTSPVFWHTVHVRGAQVCCVMLLIHGAIQGRRYLRGWKLKGALALVLVLIAGVVAGIPYLDRWFHQVTINEKAVLSGPKLKTDKKVLTVYFGRIGNTDFPETADAVSGASLLRSGTDGKLLGNSQVLAYMVQNATGGDVAAILTEKQYPASYLETTKIGKEEINNEERMTLKPMAVRPEEYDVVVLVFPVWWGTTPRAVNSFLEAHDLKGKVLLPIVTHGGSGEAATAQAIRNSTQADVKKPLTVYSSDVPRARGKVGRYLEEMIVKSEEGRGTLRGNVQIGHKPICSVLRASGLFALISSLFAYSKHATPLPARTRCPGSGNRITAGEKTPDRPFSL